MLLNSVYFFAILTTVYSANILGVFPIPMVSHQVVFRALTEGLAARGHNLTVMTTDPVDYKGKLENLKQIDVRDVSYESWAKSFNYGKLVKNSGGFQSSLSEAFVRLSDTQLKHPDMKKLLDDPNVKFDLCFIESWVEPMFPLKDRFGCNLILISSLTGSLSNFDAFGNPSNPTLFNDAFSPYFGDLDFWKRLEVTVKNVHDRYLYYFHDVPKYDAFTKSIFGSDTRSVSDIQSDADMMFINGHPIFSGIRPVVPGIIYLDSMHLKPPKPLPEGLKNILDRSKNGVIYFSLGSNVKSTQLQSSSRKAFLDAFKELPFTILWKWEDEFLPGKPDNVHIMKWMPQQDILAHPKIKAYIMQGGQQSFEEAIHHKIPLIGLPFMIDQNANVKKMIKFGIGVGLDLNTLTKDAIKSAILKVTDNDSYRLNMERLSNLIKDQPQSGLERAIWWTEHVIRNNGGRHMRSPTADVSFVRYFLLDVIAFLVLCFVVVLFSACWIGFLIKKLLSGDLAGKLKMS